MLVKKCFITPVNSGITALICATKQLSYNCFNYYLLNHPLLNSNSKIICKFHIKKGVDTNYDCCDSGWWLLMQILRPLQKEDKTLEC